MALSDIDLERLTNLKASRMSASKEIEGLDYFSAIVAANGQSPQ